jgi:hypothetical protein
MMRYIGRGQEDVEAMLKNLDEDGDGVLDMEEFQAGQGAAKVENDMVGAFAMFDKVIYAHTHLYTHTHTHTHAHIHTHTRI